MTSLINENQIIQIRNRVSDRDIIEHSDHHCFVMLFFISIPTIINWRNDYLRNLFFQELNIGLVYNGLLLCSVPFLFPESYNVIVKYKRISALKCLTEEGIGHSNLLGYGSAKRESFI